MKGFILGIHDSLFNDVIGNMINIKTEIKESDPMIIANDSNDDFSIEDCTNEEMKELNTEKERVVPATKRKPSEMDNVDDIEEIDPRDIKKNISAMNRDNS